MKSINPFRVPNPERVLIPLNLQGLFPDLGGYYQGTKTYKVLETLQVFFKK